MNQIRHFLITDLNCGQRLDLFLANVNPDLSRAFIKKLLQKQKITVNGAFYKPSYKLNPGDQIVLDVPDPEPSTALPEDIDLDIVYEDADLLVVNKPAGMVVHPAPGHFSGTLVNALLFHTKDLSGINGVLRPGILHRIDKDTSGLLMVAKNDHAHLFLSEQLKAYHIDRFYIALVKGIIKPNKGTIDMPIGRHPKNRLKMAVVEEHSKHAVTHFEVLTRYTQKYTLVRFQLETGRTHQIRVHMEKIGHPIAGDPVYGGDKKNPFKTSGQLLHAQSLTFLHPVSEKEMHFEAPLPDAFQAIIEKLTPLS